MYVYSTGEKAYIGNKSETKPPGQSGDVLVEIDKDLDVRKVYKYDGSSWILKNTVDNHGSIDDDVQGTSELDGVYVQLGENAKINKNTIILLGDSITAMNGSGKGNDTHTWIDGFFDWGNTLLNQPLNCVYNAGHSGYRTDQLIPYLNTEVFSNYSYYVHVLAGTNDIIQDISASVIIANLKNIYDSVLSKGRVVLAGTIVPNTSLSATQLDTLTTVNVWIKKYARQYNNIIIVDYWEHLVDMTTGQSKANTNTDGIHPSMYGAYLMGMAFKKAMQNYLNSVIISDFSNKGKNILVNSALKGGTTTATSWNIEGTCTPSKLTSSDLVDADYQVIQLTDSGATVHMYQVNSMDTNKANIGDTLFASVEIDSDTATLVKSTLTVECYSSGTNLLSVSGLYHGGKTVVDIPIVNLDAILKTNNFIIPADTIQFFFHIYLQGTGTVKIRKPYLSNESI